MNVIVILGVILFVMGAVIFLFALITAHKADRGKVGPVQWRKDKERESSARVWKHIGELIAIVGLVVAIVTEVHLHWVGKETEKARQEATAAKDEAKAAKEEARKAKEKADLANRNIENIEKHFGIPIYTDGLSSADSAVFDPFFEGTKLMAEYKWDGAIAEFQKAMKEAKASQLVALFNLIAICYYTSGRLDSALENYKQSLTLAEQFDDKQGKAAVLGNIGLIYQDKGDLDQALKYLEEALEIDKEIGYRQGEASALGNIGLVYEAKGDLDQALKYHQEALDISKQIDYKVGEASILGNIGNVYYLKGDLNQALKYYNEALKIFKKIGMPEQIGITKRNIERIKQMIND
jgi:tetratricopeptide (TPR) repeat protein